MSEFFTLNEKELETNRILQGQYQEYTSCFQPEEWNILAVTSANEFSAVKGSEAPLWYSNIDIIAWMEEGSQKIHQGKFWLETLASDKLYRHLCACVPNDSIIKCRVRISEDGERFLLLNVPELAFDFRLEVILKEQQEPITIQVEEIGTFILDRRIDYFTAEVDWLGSQVIVSFEQEEEPSEMEKVRKVLQILIKNGEEWDQRIRNFAADELLETANDWAQDAEEPPISREQFIMRMELDSIDVEPDGSFSFWFNDDDMFWGHVIHVQGDVENGPDWACIEG